MWLGFAPTEIRGAERLPGPHLSASGGNFTTTVFAPFLEGMRTVTSTKKLNTAQLRILEFLQSYRDPETHECTPSVQTIADAVGFSRNYVQKILGELATNGVIEKSERWYQYDDPLDTPARMPNLYKVLIAMLFAVLVGGSVSEAKGSGSGDGSQSRPYVTSRRRRFLVPEFC